MVGNIENNDVVLSIRIGGTIAMSSSLQGVTLQKGLAMQPHNSSEPSFQG
jgi:hypothetical protein